VQPGEILAVLGPSGCGKSTLLQLIAGLEQPDRGRILWEGKDLSGVPTHLRGFGLMFQEFALFPHLDVRGNVGFGLKMQGLPDEQIRTRVAEVLRVVDLEGFGGRQVDALSGGERQRVALARSLAPQPRLLMLDEPLGALDRTLRERLLLDLPAILGELGQTVIYVTHDQEEAFAIADRVVLLNAGHLVQIGTPFELYNNPHTGFAARFLGLTNTFPGRVEDVDGNARIETPFGIFPTQTPLRGEVTVLLRGDQLELGSHGPHVLRGHVLEQSFRGQTQRLKIRSGELDLACLLSGDQPVPAMGEQVELSFDPAKALQVLA
jgi:ABC-type Fe3+/spermidine/putrescine transport system ATPase subunit